MRRRRTILLILVGIIVFVSTVAAGFRWWPKNQNDAGKTATVKVTMAPADSTVTLNGSKGQAGDNRVRPGDCKVVVSHRGFATATKTITATNDHPLAVGFALVPNKKSTANWYIDHPSDAAIARTITNPQNASAVVKKANLPPFTTILPYTGGGFEFQIIQDSDYSDPNNVIIAIIADTDQAKQDALTWIRNQGYDPQSLNIKYFTSSDPTRP